MEFSTEIHLSEKCNLQFCRYYAYFRLIFNANSWSWYSLHIVHKVTSIQTKFEKKKLTIEGTKIFQYCTCPAGQVTYNFHLSCKHIHRPLKRLLCNKEHKGIIIYVIWLPWVIHPKALVLQEQCCVDNYSSFLDFTRNYKRTSWIFVPCH